MAYTECISLWHEYAILHNQRKQSMIATNLGYNHQISLQKEVI